MRLLAGFLCCCVAGCGLRVPPIPPGAADQRAQGASAGTWTAEGRCRVESGGDRVSCTLVVRATPGAVRLVLMADEGPVLLDVDGVGRVHGGRPDARLTRVATLLGQIAGHTWLPRDDQPRREGEVRRSDGPDGTRWYGGDPVLLRAVSGLGPTVFIENWRQRDQMLLPHHVRAEAMGVSIELILR
jgi:hypothetical protein